MEATMELVKKTNLEAVIEGGNIEQIKSLIAQKEIAMDEACDNVTYYLYINDREKADNELVRVKRLDKDIMALRAALH